MRIIAFIQARMSSTRLPGKIMLPLLGQPLLLRMVHRVANSKYCNAVVVITSTQFHDDVVEKLCFENNVNCFRGEPEDLLDRHYKAAIAYQADVVIKIPSDCPLIDSKVIDEVISRYMEACESADYVSNLHPASWPDGNDVEVIKFEALEAAWKEANKPYEREHTTPFIWENPQRFNNINVTLGIGLDFSDKIRLTIDYIEDYELIKAIFERLYPINQSFGHEEIINLLQTLPHLNYINSKYHGKYWYDNHLNELTHIDEYINKQRKNVH
ncbi:MAG: glycosyltransferase family protein [Bacteroidales bacterium]|nr:glycosyltransferase family protein [Bacteroidales bacterium]MDD3665850.1 glycosyltransferase family protein [Bacteroidales bacterium]